MKSNWISVEDMPPEDGNYLVTLSCGSICVMNYDKNEDDQWLCSCIGYDCERSVKVTHWMTLPDTPKKKKMTVDNNEKT